MEEGSCHDLVVDSLVEESVPGWWDMLDSKIHPHPTRGLPHSCSSTRYISPFMGLMFLIGILIFVMEFANESAAHHASNFEPAFAWNASSSKELTIRSETTHSIIPSATKLNASSSTFRIKNLERCDCFRGPKECCERTILRTHKFGYMLTQELYKPFGPTIRRSRIRPEEFTNDTDYRHVVILRNIYDAIVSGFLYHQEGHECWMSFNGGKVLKEKNFDWERLLTYPKTPDLPPRNHRSICQYLLNEEPRFAMRVYIDVALNKWYAGLEPYLEEMKRRHKTQSLPKSWLVCFEDYTDPSKQENLFQESMNFLFPSGRRQFVIPIKPEPYHGAHASSHDPVVREALLDLVYELDESVFQNTLRRLSQLYSCGTR